VLQWAGRCRWPQRAPSAGLPRAPAVVEWGHGPVAARLASSHGHWRQGGLASALLPLPASSPGLFALQPHIGSRTSIQTVRTEHEIDPSKHHLMHLAASTRLILRHFCLHSLLSNQYSQSRCQTISAITTPHSLQSGPSYATSGLPLPWQTCHRLLSLIILTKHAARSRILQPRSTVASVQATSQLGLLS
jgi:hypothetical protein